MLYICCIYVVYLMYSYISLHASLSSPPNDVFIHSFIIYVNTWKVGHSSSRKKGGETKKTFLDFQNFKI